MGISGLLPFLKKASKKTHIRHFSGQTVAVDGYCWLHKGAFGCAQKLGLGEPTVAYVTYFMKYVSILRDHGLRPIIVFDGRSLPSKEGTNKKRREKREENRIKAKEALRVGNKKEAWECFQRAIEITPAMVHEVIKVLRQQKLDYIISPYEADAQLAFLARKGIVDLIVTEDSDLVLFGCPKIFFKMSANGDGVIFDQSKLHLCVDKSPERFVFDKFRQMCIFSGCDYLDSIAGIGLARAKKVFTLSSETDLEMTLRQAPEILKLDITVTDEYVSEFQRAENTFLYQLVFDPQKRELCPLTPYATSIKVDELTYCGKYEAAKLSLDMALGNVDIKTLKSVDKFNIDDPKFGYCTEKSMWSRKYKNTPRLNGAQSTSATHSKATVVSKSSPAPTPSKGTVRTISASHILRTQIAKSHEVTSMKDLDSGDEDEKIEYYEMCRSPPSKRLRSFYSGTATISEQDEVDSINFIEILPIPDLSKTSEGDICSTPELKTRRPLNPFAVKPSGVVIRKENVVVKIVKSPVKCISNCSKPMTRVTRSKANPPSQKRKPVQNDIRIMLQRIEKGTISQASPYFTEGTKNFIDTKNHKSFEVTTGQRPSL